MTHLEVSNASRQIMVIIQIILSFIAVIIAVYYYKRFNNLSNSVMIQKRHPEILKIQGITSIIFFLIVYPLMVIDFACLNDFIIYQQEIRRIDTAIFPFFTAAIFLLVLWRFWLIFFDLKHSSSQQNTEWQYHLDPNLVQQNFWLTHKKDYGSPQYTQKIVIFVYCCGVIPMIILYQIVIHTHYEYIAHFLALLYHSFPFIGILCIFFRVPKYSDHFFIREELKKVCYAIFITIPVSWIGIIYGIAVTSLLLSLMIALFVAAIIIFWFFLLPFWFIPKMKIKFDTKNSQNNIHNSKLKSIKICDIFSDGPSFEAFMQHLAREFNVEICLCFVEMIQYKFALKERFDIIKPDEITTELIWEYNSNRGLLKVAPLSIINRQGFEQDLLKYKL
eukprot:535863_1